MLRLVVGLGNPGRRYQGTRHNAGFLVVEELRRRAGSPDETERAGAMRSAAPLGDREVVLLRPVEYMNRSGMSVLELVRKYEPQQGVLVIYDELDLPLGMIRVRARGSSAGHNGMQSIINALQTEEIARIRVGIAPDDPRKGGAKYVLAPFRKSQLATVDEALDLAAQAVNVTVNEGITVAMNRFNKKNKQEDSEEKV